MLGTIPTVIAWTINQFKLLKTHLKPKKKVNKLNYSKNKKKICF